MSLVLTLLPGVALADEWVAERLRGRVFVQIDGNWEPLARGDVVSDHSPIQSTLSGRATFERDNESITIGGRTIIQIIDLASSGPSNTVVKQHTGSVWIEAEVQEVQHFRVETPFLAAVVKGTKFAVKVTEDGAEVEVERGRVEVHDETSGQRVEITPGQSAGKFGGGPLSVDGNPVGGSESGDDGTGLELSAGAGGGNGVGLALGVGGGNRGGNGVGLSLGVGGGNSGGNGNSNGGGNSGGGVGVNVGNDDNGVSVRVGGGGGVKVGLGLLGG